MKLTLLCKGEPLRETSKSLHAISPKVNSPLEMNFLDNSTLNLAKIENLNLK